MQKKIESSGVTLERKTTDMVSGSLRPMGDRIVVKPVEVSLSDTIQANWSGRTIRGEVVAVGPGEYPWRYNTDRSKRWRSEVFVPTQVKPGDMVELGGKEIGGYQFQEIMLNGERVIMCSEKDVAAWEPANHSESVNHA